MCGIVGGIGPLAPDINTITLQLRTLSHRGPDDEGTYLGSDVSIGMRRLSIVEVDSGRQPYIEIETKIAVVFNGEIYNYKELREQLEQTGKKFVTTGEPEVIAKMYLEFGTDFVSKLNGMFSIAISDEQKNTLILIRDRVGEKPLWYSECNDGSLHFASEVKALLVVRPDKTLRRETILEVMQFGFINAPYSPFNEIKQLPPGCILIWNRGVTTLKNYWTPNFVQIPAMPYEEILKKTEILISNAVSRRLISERPMGSFLSGGIDSTIVTAMMAKLSPTPIETFSIGFSVAQYNESEFAKGVAKYLGTQHHDILMKPDPSVLIDSISSKLDLPFADSSTFASFVLANYASKKIVVALGGDGGDEVFGGYDRYFASPFLQKINPLLRTILPMMSLFRYSNLSSHRKVKRVISQLHSEPSLAHRYASMIALNGLRNLSSIINEDFSANTSYVAFVNQFNEGELSDLNRMMRSDFIHYLPGDLLFKSDFASMANSIELRSPLLDWEVVEWGISLPATAKVRYLQRKRVLKDLARTLVPGHLIDRPKMGFGIPRANWIRNGLREMTIELLTDETAKQRGWFKKEKVKEIIDLHMRGNDQDSLIWPMLMLELWARNWLD